MNGVAAIIVTHYPRAEEFLPLIERLSPQVEYLIVVDNTPGSEDATLASGISAPVHDVDCRLIRLGENKGLAQALNEGCRHALALGARFLLLSDQDSLPAEDMVSELCRAYQTLTETGYEVGAVGPSYSDLHTGLSYPFQARLPGRFFYGHKRPTIEEPHVEALTLITSGTLIPAEAFESIGPMREDFFIDQIDIEWCHRARAKGYHLFGTGWATMSHRMGETRLRVWALGWRHESAYSPRRIYYRVRNFVALLKLDYIDWRWKLRSTWYHLGLLYGHVLFGPQPLATMRMFFRGILDGLCNRMGPVGTLERFT